MDTDDDKLLSARATADMIGGVDLSTIWRWRANGTFPEPYCQVNRLNYWRRGDVQEWIERQRKITLKKRGAAAA